MTSIDFTQIKLDKLITHRVGNKLRDENILLSDIETNFEEETLNHLLKYFLSPFKPDDFFNFTHSVDLSLNEIFTVARKIFHNTEVFIECSHNIAKLLYEYSMHPKIRKGELNIALFSNVVIDSETTTAIGIFKSENDLPFIQMKDSESRFKISHQYGYDLKSVDKACFIFNVDENIGYRVLTIDNVNKSTEAQYWKDDFLKLRYINDNFHQTNNFLSLTKNFVTKHISEDFVVSKTDRIDLLNRSVDYFKSHKDFDKNNFEKEVFKDESLMESFRSFNKVFRANSEFEISDEFEISSKAVKKQAKTFKSVLKLDQNFHIYIHGSKEMIESGIDKDGRKYYKIYYEREM